MTPLLLVMLAMAATWLGALIYWIDDFGTAFEDVFIGALWAILVAILFPLIWFGVAVALAVRAIKGNAS